MNAREGSGKTLLLNATHTFLESKRKTVIAVATSTEGALLHCNERSAHVSILILISCNEDSMCHIGTCRSNFEDLMRSVKLFEGKTKLCLRGFKQTLPFVPCSLRSDVSHFRVMLQKQFHVPTSKCAAYYNKNEAVDTPASC